MSEEPAVFKTTEPKSDRKSFGIRLSPSLVKSLKLVAVKMDKPVNRVLEEAIIDFLKKHNEPIQGAALEAPEEVAGKNLLE